MSGTLNDTLRAAREAVRRHDWKHGLELFKVADATGAIGPEDLEMLAETAWCAARPSEGIEALERAYAAYVQAGRRARAGYVALILAREYGQQLSGSVSRGWFGRAERLLAQEPEGAEHGYLYGRLSLQAIGDGDLDQAIDLARRTIEIGARLGNSDLHATGALYQGMALVQQGDVARGLALIDEAALAAVSGELGPYWAGMVYCNTIGTCCELADYRRAGEWTEAAFRWGERHDISGWAEDCRVHHAEILTLRGAWAEAEDSARRGVDALRGLNMLKHVGEGHYQIGEIRLRMGDLAAAHDAFSQASELGRDPQPGLSLLLLAQGKLDAAMVSIKRALEEETSSKLARARLLPAFVQIAIEAGNVDAARNAADEIESIATMYTASAFHAAADYARGAVLLAEGDATEAARTLRRAVSHWNEISASYDAARARTLLARAIKAQGDDESAALELHAAGAAFDRLGAVPDLRRIEELLSSIEELLSSEEQGVSLTKAIRSTKAFLFTDIVKSTNLVEAVGDDAWVDLLRWHDRTLRALFTERGGEEVDHAGDGFFVVFDDPASAIACGVAIQRTLAEHRSGHGFSPTVRIGVHAATATRSGKQFRGKAVHEAARIASVAEGGEILASVEAVESSSRSFTVSETRAIRLKGIADPVEVVAIDWRQDPRG